MNHVIIADPLRVELTGFTEPTEFRDQSGRVLGVFIPAVCWSRGEWTLEQLEVALNEPGGRSVDEILQSLVAN